MVGGGRANAYQSFSLLSGGTTGVNGMALNSFCSLFSIKILQNMRQTSFILQNQYIRYNQYGDPPASLALVLWKPEENPLFVVVATYNTYPIINFTFNDYLTPWSGNGTVSIFVCIYVTRLLYCDTNLTNKLTNPNFIRSVFNRCFILIAQSNVKLVIKEYKHQYISAVFNV